MRQFVAATLAILLVCVCGAPAQDIKKPQDPEYVGEFFLLDKDSNLKALERQTARMEGRVKGFGFGGYDAKYVIPSEHSPIRFASNDTLQFVVRLATHDVDPTTVVQFYSLKVVKGQRSLLMMKAHAFGSAKQTLGDTAVPFEVAKYSEMSVLIKPQGALAPGEYVLTAGQMSAAGPQGYCFGVDSSKP
jgi:hypothetical protein